MAEQTAEQLMADVVKMYSGEGEYEKLYQSNKQKFMADVLGRLGPGLVNTTRPAAISAGYEREAGPQFAAQKTGLMATAKTNLANLLATKDALDKQLALSKHLTELGISSEEQRTKWGIASAEKIAELQAETQEAIARLGAQAQVSSSAMRVDPWANTGTFGRNYGIFPWDIKPGGTSYLPYSGGSGGSYGGYGSNSYTVPTYSAASSPVVSGYQTAFNAISNPQTLSPAAAKIVQAGGAGVGANYIASTGYQSGASILNKLYSGVKNIVNANWPSFENIGGF